MDTGRQGEEPEGYDPDQDPDADPDMIDPQHANRPDDEDDEGAPA